VGWSCTGYNFTVVTVSKKSPHILPSNLTQDTQELCEHIAKSIRNNIRGLFGTSKMRRHTNLAHSGDQSFQYDILAEGALKQIVEKLGVSVTVMSEDKGLVNYGHSEPTATLIVDPIDGTRPACIGLETCCVSVAAVNPVAAPRFSDILAGAIVRIKDSDCFSAARGQGARRDTQTLTCDPTEPQPANALFWSTEIVCRWRETPATLMSLITETSKAGGVFIWNSSAYSLTAITAGNLDAHVDVPSPDAEMGLYAYDVAAAYLILTEAGGICTLPDNTNIEDTILFNEHGDMPILQLVASRNQTIHNYVLKHLKT
jgi:fructose-1,6-bisphosphatase/inositol monophosphatase family enzyme